MKLTLGLVVVVLNVQTGFCDNYFTPIHPPLNIHKVGGRRWHVCCHAPFPTQLFHKILTPTVNKHAKMVEEDIALDIETNEAFPARETTFHMVSFINFYFHFLANFQT